MPYETLVKEAQALTETEKMDLVVSILESLKVQLNENSNFASKKTLSSMKGAFKTSESDDFLRSDYVNRKFG